MNTQDQQLIEKVEQGIATIKQGGMLILVDDEDRENEGDLVMAAELVTPEAINFMAKYGRGLICLSLTAQRCQQLDLPLMVKENSSGFGTAFTVSIEARAGVTTGISAADRATTIKAAVAKNARPYDLVRPGHIFPLRANPGGVLARTGQTEGSVDLARLAGLEPAGVICEIMKDDGTMARMPDLEIFAKEHNLLILSIADLIRYRLLKERLVQRTAESTITVAGIGTFKAYSYSNAVDHLEHLALVKGNPTEGEVILGRVHQESVMGDVFRCSGSDSAWKLEFALREIEKEGCGIVVYLQKPAPRISNELREINGEQPLAQEQHKGNIGLPSDLREFGIGAQILVDQGVNKLKLISNSMQRIKGIEGYGIQLVDQLPIPNQSAN
jgi:3,4-dihydroxy 2-butanone 4-phosphate synthase/GTP cyclohydrolase II